MVVFYVLNDVYLEVLENCTFYNYSGFRPTNLQYSTKNILIYIEKLDNSVAAN